MKNAQEWFLIKKNWMEEMEELSNEDFGAIIRALYFDGEPVGTQRVLFKTLRDEFNRVNESREETLKLKREASKKGVETKAQLSKEHKERMLQVAKSITSGEPNITSGEPVDDRTHTHTDTHTRTDTHTHTPTRTEDRGSKISNKLNNISNTVDVLSANFKPKTAIQLALETINNKK